MQEKKRKERRNPPKRREKAGLFKKKTKKQDNPHLKKEETVSLHFHRVVSQEQFGTFECGVDAYVWPQELLDVELSD